MDAFPPILSTAICVSILTSVIALVFSTLVIGISPILWMFPAAFIATAAYHAVTLLILSAVDTSYSLHVYSLPNVLASYALAAVWTAIFAVSLALTVLFGLGKLTESSNQEEIWKLIVLCVLSLAESVAMSVIAFKTQRERARVLYASKWKWRPGYGIDTRAQWRCLEDGISTRQLRGMRMTFHDAA